jgi:hypothetical protein
MSVKALIGKANESVPSLSLIAALPSALLVPVPRATTSAVALTVRVSSVPSELLMLEIDSRPALTWICDTILDASSKAVIVFAPAPGCRMEAVVSVPLASVKLAAAVLAN